MRIVERLQNVTREVMVEWGLDALHLTGGDHELAAVVQEARRRDPALWDFADEDIAEQFLREIYRE